MNQLLPVFSTWARVIDSAKRPLRCAAILMALCGAWACQSTTETNGGEPGGQEDPSEQTGGQQTDGNTAGHCAETAQDLDLAEPTALGFSAGELLDFVAGQHTESLRWLEGNGEFRPETGTSELTVTVEILGSPRYVTRTHATGSGDGVLTDIAVDCNDSVQVDALIHFASSGGALDEVVETTVEAFSGDFAQARVSFELDSLDGSFEADVEPPPNMVLTRAALDLTLGFSEYGLVGALGLLTEARSLPDSPGPGVAQAGIVSVAHFPAEDYCGTEAVSVSADQSVRGRSMAATLEALAQTSPAALTYDDGDEAELELTFSSTEERICARLAPSLFGHEPELEFSGTVSLLSSDGRVDGDIPLQFTVTTLGNDEVEILASASLYTEDLDEAATLPARVGVRDPIDASAYDGLHAVFQLRIVGDHTDGFLRISGLQIPDCQKNPPPIDPDAMGSPGCEGTQLIPLWEGTWIPAP